MLWKRVYNKTAMYLQCKRHFGSFVLEATFIVIAGKEGQLALFDPQKISSLPRGTQKPRPYR